MKIVLRIAILLLLVAPCVRAESNLQTFLERTLAETRETAHLPAVAALVQIDGKVQAQAVLGVRAEGHPEKATLSDRWHLGSDTKAMTATLIARLVEQGVMGFDDTMATSFPAFAAEMDPAYRGVTVTQLLSHTAGLPTLKDVKDRAAFVEAIKSAEGVKAQRLAIARAMLTRAPAQKPGAFAYANVGFMIAGAIAEERTGKTWEDLTREQIFAPLGIKHAGFGPPGASAKIDQPRGHDTKDGKRVALDPESREADNPPAVGPAGTINMALKDWLLFAQDQLDGVHGRGKLLKAETYRKLHTPVTENYALGWAVKVGADGALEMLAHTGSNGYWVSDVRIMPKHDMIFLTVTNVGDDAAQTAIKDIRERLNERLKPFD